MKGVVATATGLLSGILVCFAAAMAFADKGVLETAAQAAGSGPASVFAVCIGAGPVAFLMCGLSIVMVIVCLIYFAISLFINRQPK